MKHTHVIEANSAAEFKQQVGELYRELYIMHAVPHPAPPVDVPAPMTATAVQAEQPEKKPVGRPRKTAEKEENKPAEAPEDDVFGDAPKAIPYTLEDCNKRLQTVVSTSNIATAKEILARFGCAKLVDLKSDQYSAFVSACDEATP